MTDMSFDDFVNQEIAKKESSIDWDQIRDDWKKHLDEFYKLVSCRVVQTIESAVFLSPF